MKFPITLFGAALYLFSSAEAGISTNTPFKSVTWNGGDTVKVVWEDDGTAPTLDEIQGITTVDLMAGGSAQQVFVDNIGKTFAVAKEIGYVVPKDVGPPGDFYFIKYTAGDYSAFSGQFSIANVNGKIDGFNPNDPNDPNAKNATGSSPTQSPSSPASPSPSTASSPTGGSTADDPYGSSGTSGTSGSNGEPPASASNPKNQSLPSTISAATKLLSSLPGVASVAVALTFIYLY